MDRRDVFSSQNPAASGAPEKIVQFPAQKRPDNVIDFPADARPVAKRLPLMERYYAAVETIISKIPGAERVLVAARLMNPPEVTRERIILRPTFTVSDRRRSSTAAG